MILMLHVAIALISVGFTTYLFISPSKTRLYASYSLIAATLGSGTYLVWSTRAPILQACMTGLLYVGLVSLGILSAQRTLAKQKAKK